MLKNQNNFSNKSNSFIPKINSDFATPATSDLDLKSSIHSSRNFTIGEILTKLGNESEMHNDNILLFPPTDKEDVSPSHLNAPFKSSSLNSRENEKEQRREQVCTTMDLPEGFGEFQSVRLIFSEDRRLPRSFNDRASHTKKTDKSDNNYKVPAS